MPQLIAVLTWSLVSAVFLSYHMRLITCLVHDTSVFPIQDFIRLEQSFA